MAKAIAVIKADSTGAPDIGTGWHRWVWVGDLPGAWAFYIIVGTGPQLTAIDAHANTGWGMVVTSDGTNRWPQLDQAIPAGARTRLNTFLSARGLPTAPAGTTLLQVIRRGAAKYDWGLTDVWDGA